MCCFIAILWWVLWVFVGARLLERLGWEPGRKGDALDKFWFWVLGWVLLGLLLFVLAKAGLDLMIGMGNGGSEDEPGEQYWRSP